MSLGRWQSIQNSSREKWQRLKTWSLEKSKTKLARWTISIISGASLASVPYNLIPTEGAWLALNLMLTGTVFLIAARVTSHSLSSQQEAPEKAKKIAKIISEEIIQELIQQQNENILKQNKNNKFIQDQLAKLNKHLSRMSIPILKEDCKEAAELGIELPESDETLLLLNELRIIPMLEEETTQEEPSNCATLNKIWAQTIGRCWNRNNLKRKWGLFHSSDNTELTTLESQVSYQSEVLALHIAPEPTDQQPPSPFRIITDYNQTSIPSI